MYSVLPVEGLLDVEGLELVNVFTVLCELALADTEGCVNQTNCGP